MKYWQERALAIQADARDLALTTELRVQKVYRDHGRASVKEYMELVKSVPDIKAAYRTDRQFRMKYDRTAAHIKQSFDKLASIVDKETLDLMIKVYKQTIEGYGVTALSFNLINDYAIRQVCKTPWCSDGLIYSDRVWNNTSKLKARLSDTLLSSVVKGENIQKTARTIQKDFGVSLNQAKRLIRTETSAIYTAAALDSYSIMGMDYYEVIGEPECHDTGVCPVGEVYRVDEAGFHDTPPFHPSCKCCIAPVPNYKMA